MGIYAGVNGVVRQINSLDAGRYYSVYHTHSYKAGVSGVVRDLTDITSQIDHIEISVENIYTDTIDTNGDWVSSDGYDLETANKYGKVEVDTSNKWVRVWCYTALKEIYAYSYIYVVFKDGHKVGFGDLISSAPGTTFQFQVYGYVYFSTTGWYNSICLGEGIVENYVSGSKSARKYLTSVSSYNDYAYVLGALRYNGRVYSQLTFEKMTINGTVFPIVLVNNLS